MRILPLNQNYQNTKFKGVTPLVCENKMEFRKFIGNLKKLLGKEYRDTFDTRDFTGYYKSMYNRGLTDHLSKFAGAVKGKEKGKRVYIIYSGVHLKHADCITNPPMYQDSRHLIASQEGELNYAARLIAPDIDNVEPIESTVKKSATKQKTAAKKPIMQKASSPKTNAAKKSKNVLEVIDVIA